LPLDLHKTPLGRMLYDARARLIPPERLIRPADVARLLGVSRQTVSDWVENRTLTPEYLHGELRFDRDHIEAFPQQWKPRRKRKLTSSGSDSM
jgi:excisionase family DNA binding protein